MSTTNVSASQVLSDMKQFMKDFQQALADQKSLVTTLKNIVNSQLPPDSGATEALNQLDSNILQMDNMAKAFDPGAITAGAPVITNTNLDTPLANAVGAGFSLQIEASNGPNTFTANGLPDGTSIDQNTGLISGTTTTAGTFSVSVIATNAAGSDTASFSVVVS